MFFAKGRLQVFSKDHLNLSFWLGSSLHRQGPMTGCYVNWFVVKQQTRDSAVAWRGPKKKWYLFLYACYLHIFWPHLICSSLLIKARSECLIINSETLLKTLLGVTCTCHHILSHFWKCILKNYLSLKCRKPPKNVFKRKVATCIVSKVNIISSFGGSITCISSW